MGGTIDNDLRRAVEGMYEDERLRSGLTDDEATALLDWGRLQLEKAARSTREDDREEGFRGMANRLHEMIRQIGRLASQNSRLSDAQFEDILRRLVSQPGAERALPPAAVRVLGDRRSLDSRKLIGRLTELAAGAFPEDTSTPA